jgi:hypothetical protein
MISEYVQHFAEVPSRGPKGDLRAQEIHANYMKAKVIVLASRGEFRHFGI